MTYKKLFLTGGHGKKGANFDPGAVAADKTTERQLIVAIGKKALDKFADNGLGTFVQDVGILEDLTLAEKTKRINDQCKKEGLDYKNSLLLSLHVDWRGAAEGVGAYFYGGSKESEDFANTVAGIVARVGDRKKKWIKPDTSSRFGRLGIIRDTDPLAMLLEMGSLKADDNQKDGLELLKSEQGQEEISQAIFEAILHFAGIDTPEPKKTPEAPKIDLEFIKKENSRGWEKLEQVQKDIVEVQGIFARNSRILRGEEQ